MNASSAPTSICYVSAFLDIGRERWRKCERKVSSYFNCFSPFVQLFSKNSKDTMIVYIDDKYFDHFSTLIKGTSIQAIPININFMNNHIFAWSKLAKEREIMNSDEYRDAFPMRLSYPENTIPEYTLINHSKIDFVNLAMKICNFNYFCWVDFGFFQIPQRIPRSLLDINKLDTTRINYQLLNPITEKDNDIIYTIEMAPERIGGFFFFGRRDKMVEYQALYHETLEYFQDNNIADDDQHLALRCYFKNPNLFKLHLIRIWHFILVMLQS